MQGTLEIHGSIQTPNQSLQQTLLRRLITAGIEQSLWFTQPQKNSGRTQLEIAPKTSPVPKMQIIPAKPAKGWR
jgi:hypothetical protein